MRPSPRAAVNLWTAGFGGAALIQGALPRAFARSTRWGYNAGWQREITIWNVGTLTAITALRRHGVDADRSLIAGFGVLSALFGANHLHAALRSPRSLGNWAGVLANGVGLAAGIAAMTRRSPAAVAERAA
jgi:uncharacterized membrane protein HdeD (DUF308 family)